MHAALAYLSDEIRTVDEAIALRRTLPHSVMLRSSFLSLPPELLSIIRSHLLLAITAQLMDRSVTALQRYESTLRVLLCPDCIAYNQEVFGRCIWNWEQFSGACGCLQRGWRLNNVSIAQPISSTINPKQFVDRGHWLEYYLSRKSLRFLQGRTTSPKRSPEIIWDAVSVVLQEFNCKLVSAKERRRRQMCRDVTVVPRVVENVPMDGHADEWMNGVALNRVDRDLGLSLHDSAFCSEEPCHPLSPSPSRPYHSAYQKLHSWNYELACVQPTLDSLTSLISTLLTIPVAFTTLFLTIVCLYSRPGAFRVM